MTRVARTHDRGVALAQTRGGKELIIAFFDNLAGGQVATRVLAEEAGAAGRRGIVGMLALDDAGEIDVTKLGDRTSGEGPGVGAVLGVIAMALTGDAVPKRGRLFDAGSDLSTDDVVRLAAQLEAGQSAVAVLDQRPEAERVIVRLAVLGGKTEVHHLTDRALRQAASAPPITSP